jgi:hypothetical protein
VQPSTPVAVSEADSAQLHLSSAVVEAPEPCVSLNIAVADRYAGALIDSGANACFVSQGFCMKHRIPVHSLKHGPATLANSSSATIQSQSTHHVVKIQQFSARVVFQVLDTLDGIVVVLGMNFLCAYSSSILPKCRSVSIPMHDGSCLVEKSARQAPAFTEILTDTFEVVSGAPLAQLVAKVLTP